MLIYTLFTWNLCEMWITKKLLPHMKSISKRVGVPLFNLRGNVLFSRLMFSLWCPPNWTKIVIVPRKRSFYNKFIIKVYGVNQHYPGKLYFKLHFFLDSIALIHTFLYTLKWCFCWNIFQSPSTWSKLFWIKSLFQRKCSFFFINFDTLNSIYFILSFGPSDGFFST